jgi:hypothetical protein
MPKKRLSAEQIVTLLRQIEVSMAQGKSAPVAWGSGVRISPGAPLYQGFHRNAVLIARQSHGGNSLTPSRRSGCWNRSRRSIRCWR